MYQDECSVSCLQEDHNHVGEEEVNERWINKVIVTIEYIKYMGMEMSLYTHTHTHITIITCDI